MNTDKGKMGSHGEKRLTMKKMFSPASERSAPVGIFIMKMKNKFNSWSPGKKVKSNITTNTKEGEGGKVVKREKEPRKEETSSCKVNMKTEEIEIIENYFETPNMSEKFDDLTLETKQNVDEFVDNVGAKMKKNTEETLNALSSDQNTEEYCEINKGKGEEIDFENEHNLEIGDKISYEETMKRRKSTSHFENPELSEKQKVDEFVDAVAEMEESTGGILYVQFNDENPDEYYEIPKEECEENNFENEHSFEIDDKITYEATMKKSHLENPELSEMLDDPTKEKVDAFVEDVAESPGEISTLRSSNSNFMAYCETSNNASCLLSYFFQHENCVWSTAAREKQSIGERMIYEELADMIIGFTIWMLLFIWICLSMYL